MEEVYKWARWLLKQKGFDTSDADILKKQKINGEVLLGLTKPELVSVGMPLGPASALAEAIKNLRALPGRDTIAFSLSFKWNTNAFP